MTHRQHYLDANTRRYPRTMVEAFGPYTSNDLEPKQEPDRPLDWQDRLVIQACAVCVVELIVVVIVVVML